MPHIGDRCKRLTPTTKLFSTTFSRQPRRAGYYLSANAFSTYIAVRSRHPNGVNASMCDGSTRFVSNNVNLFTWVAASSMGAGETLGDF